MKYSEQVISITPEKYQAECRALQGMLGAAKQRIEVLLREKKALEEKLNQTK